MRRNRGHRKVGVPGSFFSGLITDILTVFLVKIPTILLTKLLIILIIDLYIIRHTGVPTMLPHVPGMQLKLSHNATLAVYEGLLKIFFRIPATRIDFYHFHWYYKNA